MAAAAEVTADLRQGSWRVLAGQKHGQHPGMVDGAGPMLRLQAALLKPKGRTYSPFDIRQPHTAAARPHKISQCFFGKLQGNWQAEHVRGSFKPVHTAGEFAGVASQMGGDVVQHHLVALQATAIDQRGNNPPPHVKLSR